MSQKTTPTRGRAVNVEEHGLRALSAFLDLALPRSYNCPDCEGEGFLVDRVHEISRDEHPSAAFDEVPCERCQGVGQLTRQLSNLVHIPAAPFPVDSSEFVAGLPSLDDVPVGRAA